MGLPPKIPLNKGHSFRGLESDHTECFLELSWAYIITFTIPLAIGKLRQCSKTLQVILVLLLMVRSHFCMHGVYVLLSRLLEPVRSSVFTMAQSNQA